ncbi:VWA domain-containing protein [Actinomadura kijaniata]|uniref:VWA domain-containing protein n=1 Tax=Actinomadura kijaniata TaxID=46161 RepID=UPI003F1BCF7C
MTGPDEDGSERRRREPAPRPGPVRQWAERFSRLLFIEISVAVVVTVLGRLVDRPFLRHIALPLLGVVLVSGALVAVYVLLRHRHELPDRVAAALRWTGDALAWVFGGAAVTGLVLLLVLGGRIVYATFRPCGPPLALRVTTTPELLAAVRDAADAFSADRRDHGCRRHTFSVTAEPGVVPLAEGFRQGWRRTAPTGAAGGDVSERLLGPQPDVWIPSSTAELAYVRGQQTGGVRLEDTGSVGRTPMVLGLFARERQAAATPAGPVYERTSDLLRTLERNGLPLRGVVRPVPETSAAALAVTPALHAADPAEYDETDGLLAAVPDGLLATDAVSLLCRFRMMADPRRSPPEGVAVAVPEQALADYGTGRPLSEGCSGGALPENWRLYPHYAADLPMLDHPFVHVRWPGEDTLARSEAVADFREWLRGRPLALRGLRDRGGTAPPADAAHPLSDLRRALGGAVPVHARGTPVSEVTTALQLVGATRVKVSVSLLVDVSGSMGGGTGGNGGGSRLARAGAFAQALVAQLHRTDSVGLQAFSRPAPATPRVPSQLAEDPHRNLVTGRVQALAVEGGDLPLADALGQAEVAPARTDIVLVTDGQGTGGNPGARDRAERVAARFREARGTARLTVALTGPARCGDAPVRDVVAAFGGAGSCVEITGAPVQDQAAAVLSALRKARGPR